MSDSKHCDICGAWYQDHHECLLPKRLSELSPAPGSAAVSRDQQWIQEMCELVKNKMPENYSFVVFGFPTVESGRCYYASNATRESAITALKEWIKHAETDFLKHK